MKSFANFIVELNRGQTNAALTAHVDELLQAVKSHGRPGKLKITLNISPTRNSAGADTINVVCDSQLALPKPQQPADFFFLTEAGEPTRQHPLQHEFDMPVREVKSADHGAVIDPTQQFSKPDADGVINPTAPPQNGQKAG